MAIDLNQMNQYIAEQRRQLQTSLIDPLNASKQGAIQAQLAVLDDLEKQYNTQGETYKNNYAKDTQNEYLKYRQTQLHVPQQLQSAGIYGSGAAEGSLVDMRNAYGKNTAGLLEGLNNSLNTLELNRTQARTDNAQKVANIENDYGQRIASANNQADTLAQQRGQDWFNQQASLEELALKQAQDARNAELQKFQIEQDAELMRLKQAQDARDAELQKFQIEQAKKSTSGSGTGYGGNPYADPYGDTGGDTAPTYQGQNTAATLNNQSYVPTKNATFGNYNPDMLMPVGFGTNMAQVPNAVDAAAYQRNLYANDPYYSTWAAAAADPANAADIISKAYNNGKGKLSRNDALRLVQKFGLKYNS